MCQQQQQPPIGASASSPPIVDDGRLSPTNSAATTESSPRYSPRHKKSHAIQSKNVQNRRPSRTRNTAVIKSSPTRRLSSVVAFITAAYVMLSAPKRSSLQFREGKNLDSLCQQQQQQQQSFVRPTSLFAWLLVDAFGLSPSHTAASIRTTTAATRMQCTRNSPHAVLSYNSLTVGVWGARRQSYLVCRSTINGETEVVDASADVNQLTSSDSITNNNGHVNGVNGVNHDESTVNGSTDEKQQQQDTPDVPMPTEAGGYSHTSASKAKISAANKGKTPWNKGKSRSEEVKARIAEGVRRKNRERFLAKLAAEGITEEEYNERKKEKRRAAEAERRARKTAAGGYKPTEETKQKISRVLKEKYASGELKRKPRDPSTIRKGFKHSEETKAKIAETLRRKWAEDQEYREYMTSRTIAGEEVRNDESVRARISATLKKKWEDPEFRASMMEKFKNRKRDRSTSKDYEHRRKISEAMKKKWEDDEYRKKATKGMAKQRESAGPRMVKPRQPKGSVTRLDPLKKTVKKVKKKKKKKSSVKKSSSKSSSTSSTKSKVDATPITAMEPMSAEASREMPVQQIQEEEDLPEGSIERLRRDRKDLYDLLYGDDDDEVSVVEEIPMEIEDVSFTNMLLGGASKGVSSTMKGRGLAAKKQDPGPKPMFAKDPGASKLASLLADDEDLDDFDPYGLDNF